MQLQNRTRHSATGIAFTNRRVKEALGFSNISLAGRGDPEVHFVFARVSTSIQDITDFMTAILCLFLRTTATRRVRSAAGVMQLFSTNECTADPL